LAAPLKAFHFDSINGLQANTGAASSPFRQAATHCAMIDKCFAEHFANDWIDSWNSYDLDRILSHYSDDFEMSSPLIAQIAGEPSGRLKGKEAVGAYWKKALTLIPNLRFELVTTLVGANSITIYYRGHRGMAAEDFHFDHAGKVSKAFAHYAL
jgi:SnoaL-like domain